MHMLTKTKQQPKQSQNRKQDNNNNQKKKKEKKSRLFYVLADVQEKNSIKRQQKDIKFAQNGSMEALLFAENKSFMSWFSEIQN